MLSLVNRLAVNEKETCMDTLKDVPLVTWLPVGEHQPLSYQVSFQYPMQVFHQTRNSQKEITVELINSDHHFHAQGYIVSDQGNQITIQLSIKEKQSVIVQVREGF